MFDSSKSMWPRTPKPYASLSGMSDRSSVSTIANSIFPQHDCKANDSAITSTRGERGPIVACGMCSCAAKNSYACWDLAVPGYAANL